MKNDMLWNSSRWLNLRRHFPFRPNLKNMYEITAHQLFPIFFWGWNRNENTIKLEIYLSLLILHTQSQNFTKEVCKYIICICRLLLHYIWYRVTFVCSGWSLLNTIFRALNRNNIILAKGLLYLIPCSLEKEICRSLCIKTTNPNPNSQEGRLGGLV